MPQNSEILDLAPIAGYLAANAKSKTVLFNNFGRLNPLLPQQIYALYFIIKKIYDKDPNYSGMTAACLYLWEIMGRYGVAAQGITGSGGSVPSPTPSNQGIYPFVITSADFEPDGVSYNNPNIVGDNLELFPNQLNQQFWYAGQGFFVYTATGIRIIYDGFSANTQDWTIRIDQVFGNGVPPVTTYPYIFDTTFDTTFN